MALLRAVFAPDTISDAVTWLTTGQVTPGCAFGALLADSSTVGGEVHAFLRSVHQCWDELLSDGDNDTFSNSVSSLSSPQRSTFQTAGGAQVCRFSRSIISLLLADV